MDAALIKELQDARNAIDRALVALNKVAQPPELRGRVICFGSKLTADEKAGVLWIEEKLKLNPDYLMACMAFETGGTFSPSIKNLAGSSGTGLIQFMAFTAVNLGTTVDELRGMTRLKQLGYVYKYFKAFGTDLSDWGLEDTYMAILYPKMIGKDLDATFPWPKASLSYKQNAGLDKNKDGLVTKREASAGVRRMYEVGMAKELVG